MTDNPNQWTPPDWMKQDVDMLLRMAAAGRLHTRTGGLTGTWAWSFDHAEEARPATDEQSEALWILEERGFVTPTVQRVLKDESGEAFTADRMEITQAGRELLDRLNPKR